MRSRCAVRAPVTRSPSPWCDTHPRAGAGSLRWSWQGAQGGASERASQRTTICGEGSFDSLYFYVNYCIGLCAWETFFINNKYAIYVFHHTAKIENFFERLTADIAAQIAHDASLSLYVSKMVRTISRIASRGSIPSRIAVWYRAADAMVKASTSSSKFTSLSPRCAAQAARGTACCARSRIRG